MKAVFSYKLISIFLPGSFIEIDARMISKKVLCKVVGKNASRQVLPFMPELMKKHCHKVMRIPFEALMVKPAYSHKSC